MFKNVIVKTPCKNVCEGITGAPELGKPIYEKALLQHSAYIEALKGCGVKVTLLEADDEYPDSCFVEDVAVVTENCAVITTPGAASRNGETKGIIPVISNFYESGVIEYIKAPATLEGGDVMMAGDTFYVGKSARTNEEGIGQFTDILSKYGYKVIPVPLERVLHLKTGVNYIENNTLLVCGEFIDKKVFSDYKKIIIPESESYAANCIWVNSKVLVPAGYPITAKLIEQAGYEVVLVDTSEFRKIDGGLSCLSLRF